MLSAPNSGTIDVALNVPAKDIKKYRNNEKYEVLDILRTGPVYVAKQFTVVNKRVKGVKLVEEIPMFNDAWVDQ